jgi:hypothetical protein
VKISEDELYGRIIRLALDDFFDEWRSASDVAKELLRRGWLRRTSSTSGRRWSTWSRWKCWKGRGGEVRRKSNDCEKMARGKQRTPVRSLLHTMVVEGLREFQIGSHQGARVRTLHLLNQ